MAVQRAWNPATAILACPLHPEKPGLHGYPRLLIGLALITIAYSSEIRA